MGNVTLPLGAANSGTNDWADVHNEDQAIVDVVNGNIENVNIKAAAGIVDSKLASPNNSAYKTILSADTFVSGDAAAGTYMMGRSPRTSGTAIANSADANCVYVPPVIYFDNDDYTVGGLTQKLRLRAQVLANATQPAITFTFGLYPVTVAGTADNLTITLGTVVSSSTVAAASPTASTANSYVNSDFTIPSDGAFTLAVVTSAQLTNNAAVSLHAQLQTRNV